MTFDLIEWVKEHFDYFEGALLAAVLTQFVVVVVQFLEVRRYRRASEENDQEHDQEIRELQFEVDKLRYAIYGDQVSTANNLEDEEGVNMEPITAIGVLGSLASIASLLQSRGEAVTQQRIRDYAADQLAKEQGVKELSKNDAVAVTELANIYIRLHNADDKILDRIKRKCLAPLDKAYDDDGLDNEDVDQIREKSRICVCQLLKHVEMDNGGELRSKEFKALNRRFRCSMLK